MIEVPEIVIERIETAVGVGESLSELALKCAQAIGGDGVVGVIAATFSNPERFPALSVKVASALGLSAAVAAFDLQLACSAYPYAVYLAGRLAADLGGKVLVIDGDVQSRLVDAADHATGSIFSDAVTASLISVNPAAKSGFSFLSRHDEALQCSETGPIRMDGFKVFSFVATEVTGFLRDFGDGYDFFAPHQANPYMVRQLARSLKAEEKLLTVADELKNPGSCSVAIALKANAKAGRVLIAGFGAGYSASAGIVRYLAR